ncbi:recombinase family protein [Tepidicaulis sp. LMO-SS28]|uniref:recombinase family protein n=1 Tax=Tepidicaulis sp. LMO-SS28 TaxID=3447455 RepID=UPI003EDF63C7
MSHQSIRVAIYARYSSDLQNPASIEDQIALCRTLMTRHFDATEPVAIFSDAALSGATTQRPGLQRMLIAAESHQFDVLIAEGLDRISRSLADIASIHEVLQHCGVTIWTGHEGAVTDLHIGFKGTMNALFLRDMKDKVRRSHRAIASSGRAAAGIAYGYRVVRGVLDDKGQYINGLREIHPEHAEIVRRIFREYADGIPVRQIVRSLNDEGVPSPSGKLWRVNSVSGEGSRHRGILYNDLYRGILVYNRMKKVVDPRTQKRKYVLNPREEWITAPAPHLRIVSDDLWSRVHARRANAARQPGQSSKVRKRKRAKSPIPIGAARPLTGLVKCGWCGGMKHVANHTRYVCVTHRYEHKCKNSRGWREVYLASLTMASLETFIDQVPDWKSALFLSVKQKLSERLELEAEAKVLDLRIGRLFDAVENGIKMDWERLRRLQNRRDEIRSLSPVPNENSSHEEIKRALEETIEIIQQEWDNKKYATPIRLLLQMVVKEIVCTPIEGKARGEVVDVQLRPANEWADFFIHIHSHWPHRKSAKRSLSSHDQLKDTAGHIDAPI